MRNPQPSLERLDFSRGGGDVVTKGKGDWRENGERKWQGRAVEGRGRSADLGVSATLGARAAREDPRLRG